MMQRGRVTPRVRLSCVCCGDVVPDSRELRCPPCQAAFNQFPTTFSVFRSWRDGCWYPLHLGRFVVDWRMERTSFATLDEAVAFIKAWSAELERRWHASAGEWRPPTSDGAA